MIAAAAGALAAICIANTHEQAVVQAERFTLAWQHTIEKVDWEEDYVVAGRWLYLSSARIRGSGAGMEPPPDAVLVDGAWQYRPRERWFESIRLARSGFGDDHRLCIEQRCRPLSAWIVRRDEPTTITACRIERPA